MNEKESGVYDYLLDQIRASGTNEETETSTRALLEFTQAIATKVASEKAQAELERIRK